MNALLLLLFLTAPATPSLANRKDDSAAHNRIKMYETGVKCLKSKDYVKAEEVLGKVLKAASISKDTLMEANCLRNYARIFVFRDKPSPWGTVQMLGRVKSELGQPLSAEDMEILSLAYSKLGNSEEAAYWLGMALDSREDNADELSREKELTANLRLWGQILFICAVLATLFWYFRARKIQTDKLLAEEREETEKYMTIAEELRDKLQRSSKRLPAEKHLSIAKLDVLERLCEQYYIYEGTENLQPKILKEVKNVIGELRSDSSREGMEMMLDRNMENVISRLKQQVPKLSDEDLRLFTYVASGLSSTTISTILEKDKSVIYNRIWRLKNRLSGSGAPDKDFFLECLGK